MQSATEVKRMEKQVNFIWHLKETDRLQEGTLEELAPNPVHGVIRITSRGSSELIMCEDFIRILI